jgi:catalase (peroxidase I)
LKDIPNPTFSMGDLLSFAGKIAMEETAPCLKLKWRYGRGNCDDPLSEISNAPNGTIDTLEKYTPFLDRYNFTAKEMAILTAGTHGIATAAAAPENSGFGPFDFTLTNSGQDWIKNTIEGEWEESLSEKNQKQYTARFGASTFMRLPSDFVFFPKKLQSFSASVFDLKLNDVQEYLVSFLGKERGAFDNEFKVVYEKMLEIGVDPTKMTVFEEPLDVLECTDEYYPPLLALSGFTTKNVIALSCCILSMVLGFFGLVYVTK